MWSRTKRFFSLVKKAGEGVSTDKVPTMGAALAYYTAFSIAPLIVIALGVIGLAYGKGGGSKVFESIGSIVGDRGADAIRSMVQAASSRPKSGTLATILGIVTLVAGASGIFSQLQESLNIVWKVAKKPSAGWWSLIRQRLLSFGMVGVIAFLLLVSLLASAAVSAAGARMQGTLPGGESLWHLINVLVSIGVTTFLFAIVFKVLPDVKLPWKDALVGGLFTAVLFAIGKLVIGAYIGKSGTASSYGAAGSLIVVLLWVFYSSQLALFGAEFTQAYATRDGRVVQPRADATVTVTPFTAAAVGERAARGKKTRVPSAGAPGGSAGSAVGLALSGVSSLPSYLAAAASVAVGGLLVRRASHEERARGLVEDGLGGLLLGLGAALTTRDIKARVQTAARH